LKELVLANNRLDGAIPNEFSQLASLEVFQIQNNNFSSFKALEFLATKEYLVFDYDKDDRKLEFKDINFKKTRMAETKFEDLEE
jgi:UDP-N-acetylglucosamine pyrophosphorylase